MHLRWIGEQAGLLVNDQRTVFPAVPTAQYDFHELVNRHGLDLIQLIAPTTPADRSARILKNASGFVYCIAVAGTTGAREALAPQLAGMLKTLRSQTSLPLAVGFGRIHENFT